MLQFSQRFCSVRVSLFISIVNEPYHSYGEYVSVNMVPVY